MLKELSRITKVAVSNMNTSDTKILKDGFTMTVVFLPKVSEEVLDKLKRSGVEAMYKETHIDCRLVENNPHARKSERKSEMSWMIPVIVAGVVILVVIVLAVIYVRRRKKRKGNGPPAPVHEFWNQSYEECPIKGLPLESPVITAPQSGQEEVRLDDLNGKAQREETKEDEEVDETFLPEMDTLKLQFENPMFESNA